MNLAQNQWFPFLMEWLIYRQSKLIGFDFSDVYYHDQRSNFMFHCGLYVEVIPVIHFLFFTIWMQSTSILLFSSIWLPWLDKWAEDEQSSYCPSLLFAKHLCLLQFWIWKAKNQNGESYVFSILHFLFGFGNSNTSSSTYSFLIRNKKNWCPLSASDNLVCLIVKYNGLINWLLFELWPINGLI